MNVWHLMHAYVTKVHPQPENQTEVETLLKRTWFMCTTIEAVSVYANRFGIEPHSPQKWIPCLQLVIQDRYCFVNFPSCYEYFLSSFHVIKFQNSSVHNFILSSLHWIFAFFKLNSNVSMRYVSKLISCRGTNRVTLYIFSANFSDVNLTCLTFFRDRLYDFT